MFAGIGDLLSRAGSAWAAFREPTLVATLGAAGLVAPADLGVWGHWPTRLQRYEVNWSSFESTAFRKLAHAWAKAWMASNGTYAHARAIYNPATAVGEFYGDHLWGGALDPAAGDGEKVDSALPILTRSNRLRRAIACVWASSAWQTNKGLASLYGPVLGDVGLKPFDDPKKGHAGIEVVHPGELYRCDRDRLGHCKSYEIRRWVADPRYAPDRYGKPRYALLTETADRDGRNVVFRNTLNGKPFAWNGVAAAWEEPYGFVPFVLINHRDLGLGWGANAWHTGRSRFVEVDDQASILSDANRRALKGPMLMAGVTRPQQLDVPNSARPRGKPAGESTDDDGTPSGQDDQLYIYTKEAGAKAYPLANKPDLAGSCAHIRSMLDGCEQLFPEILADAGIGGGITAEAIRNARQLAGGRCQNARIAYDDGLVRAQQMAIAIGGENGYPGFEGFHLGSFAAGRLDHSIGKRDVFQVDPRDIQEADKAFWETASKATSAGLPLEIFLQRNGWSDEEIAKVAELRQVQQRVATSGDPNIDPANPGVQS